MLYLLRIPNKNYARFSQFSVYPTCDIFVKFDKFDGFNYGKPRVQQSKALFTFQNFLSLLLLFFDET